MRSVLVAVVVLAGLLVVAVAAASVLGGLLIGSRRRVARLTARVEELQAPPEVRRRRTLVPDPRDVVKGVWETASLVKDKGFGVALRTSVEDLAGWAEVERPDLVRLAGASGTVAILFSDIEGSTTLNEELGDRAWVRLLERHDKAVRRCVDAQEGHVVKTQGDGFMVAFSLAEQAVRCAVAIQQAFERGRERGRTPVQVRVGVHAGDVVHRDGDIFGRNVAQAARVAALAEGGEILVTEAVAEAVEDLDGITLGEPRSVELKGLTGEHQVLAVEWAA